MNGRRLWILVRGGGDLASGVVVRLHRAGLWVAVTELEQPLVVRRRVAFAEAVYDGTMQVEEVTAELVMDFEAARTCIKNGKIPVVVDPEVRLAAELRSCGHPTVVIDARMTKRPPDTGLELGDLVIGLGPGFIPGLNCHAAIETQRGHNLGRVLWNEAPAADTGIPDQVAGRSVERVLRAPANGELRAQAEIGDRLHPGQVVASVAGLPVVTPFGGVLRGLVRPGLEVTRGLKIGDVDPRDDPSYCFQISDKALAIGGAVLEALLSRPQLRPHLWGA